MNLAIMPDLQTQMRLVIECFTRHNCLGTQTFRYSAIGWKQVQKCYHIEHNVYCRDLGDPLKWKAVPSGPTAFLHYPDRTLYLGHVLVGTGQVNHRYTCNILNQRLQGHAFAVGMNHCDLKTTLEIILINLLESLEYLRHRAVHDVIDGCECDIAAKRQEELILIHKKIYQSSKMLIPQVRPARKYSIYPWEMNHLPWEIEQQAYNLIRITRLCVTSHSQPLINAHHLMSSNKLIVNNNK
jgi:hypothetical protein